MALAFLSFVDGARAVLGALVAPLARVTVRYLKNALCVLAISDFERKPNARCVSSC